MENDLPTFSSDGTMLGNLTSSQGQTPAPSFSLPSETTSLAGLTAPAASNGVSPASVVPAAAATGTPSTPTAAPASTSWWQVSVGQVAIVIVGFIFVGAGLLMFRSGEGVVSTAAKVATI